MKYSFLLLALLLFVACSKKQEPTPVPGPTVTYTDSAGKTFTITAYQTSLIVGAPLPSGTAMRFIVLHIELPDASQADLLYNYAGTGFPRTTSPVSLYTYVNAAQYAPGASTGTYYGVAHGSLTVDSVSPALVSGSYAGPLEISGTPVMFRFQRLPVQ